MMSRKSIVGAVSVGLALAWGTARARADVPITVPVSPGTDVGVGFGELSPGAHSLQITLEASGDYVITRSNWADPSGEHVWTPAEITEAGQQHVYTVYGVFSNDAHAVKFHGFLGRGPGQGPPPVFDVAVGDIDLDIDSDNDSTAEYRPASGTQAEDEAEYVGTSTPSSNAPGMGVSTGSGWAKMTVKANVKKPGKMVVAVPAAHLSLESPQWLFADSSFNALTPAAGGDVEGCGVTVFEADVTGGENQWTLYFKPHPNNGVEGDIIALTAALVDAGASSTSPMPIDRAVVRNENWTLGGDGGSSTIVVVDAAGVYEDAEYPATMERICVRPPSWMDAGFQFRLKRTHPEGQSAKIRVYYSLEEDLQEVTFTDDFSDTAFAVRKSGDETLYEIFLLKGMPVSRGSDEDPWAAAPDYASDNYEDQGIEVYLCAEGGTPQPPAVAAGKQTALWVKLSIRSQGAVVSADNAALPAFQVIVAYNEANRSALGALGNESKDGKPRWHKGNGLSVGGLGQAVEISGDVFPPDLPSKPFEWKRRFAGGRIYVRGKDDNEQLTLSPGPDKCAPDASDVDHRSGGSNGKIYNIDTPGPSERNISEFWAKDTIYRSRMNFFQRVVLNRRTVSEIMPWYVRISRNKKDNGDSEFQNEGGDDENVGRRGTTKLGWGTDTEPDMRVVLQASPEYGTNTLTAEFDATVYNGDPNYSFLWKWFGEQGQPLSEFVDGVSQPTNTRTLSFTGTPANNGEHQVTMNATSDNGEQEDSTYLMVYTNKPPIVRVTDFHVTSTTISVRADVTDPEEGAIAWDPNRNNMAVCIVQLDANGNLLGGELRYIFTDVRSGYSRAVLDGAKAVLVQVVGLDSKNLDGSSSAYKSL